MTLEEHHRPFILEALSLARQAMRKSAPFGAVMVRDGVVVARGMNESLPRFDPTAHAEVMCIRAAGTALAKIDFSDCILYSSCEPCPMCLAACYWARIPEVYFAATSSDALDFGFDDAAISKDMLRNASERKIVTACILQPDGRRVFEEWGQAIGTLQGPARSSWTLK